MQKDAATARRWRVPSAVGAVLLAVVGLLSIAGDGRVPAAVGPPRAGATPATPTDAGAAPTPTDAGPTPAIGSASRLMGRPRTLGAWPGRNGLSGVNGDPILDRANVERFCRERGRACELAHTYTDRRSYEEMTRDSGWVFAHFAGFPGVLVVSQALVPDGRPQDLPGCARGDFDGLWRDFGNVMERAGRADSVVRLGWEFNGDMAWQATDTATWIACYRRAATAIRATNPAVLLDWTINGHGTPATICGGVSTNCYPGDAYVDIIGIDNYDHFPAARTQADFDRIAAEPDGLDWLYAFAKVHGKPFSVGEWGVVPTGDAGRENPEFIRWMHAWFAAHAPDLAYEAYFSDCGAGGVQSSLFRPDAACWQNPGSAAAYRTLFGQ